MFTNPMKKAREPEGYSQTPSLFDASVLAGVTLAGEQKASGGTSFAATKFPSLSGLVKIHPSSLLGDHLS